MAVHPDDRRPDIRAGDADREQTIELLRSHVSDGRLSMDEFEDRVALVWMARTFGDLDRITDDLPVPQTARTPAPRPAGPPIRQRPDRPTHKGTAQVAGTLAVIAIFLVVIWALAGGGYFWPIWPIAAFGLVIGLKAVNTSR
jgi:hypothetical protein